VVALGTVAVATFQHIILAYTALAASILLSIPLAVVALYNERFAAIVMTFANLVQAVPSLAVVAFVVPLLGIGFWPAILAIMLRAVLPIIKNTWIGLSSVDPSLIDSAQGIGLTDWQIIRYIRFPNAYPAIFAGIKFAAILANSVAILTAIIGSGGLGSVIFEGLAGVNIATLMAGALPAIGIAVFIDASFTVIEKRISPKYLEEEK
jgi:osmoprotectant transport system permease protein